MTQAVEDGATRPVYYESRVIKLHLDKDTLALLMRLMMRWNSNRTQRP